MYAKRGANASALLFSNTRFILYNANDDTRIGTLEQMRSDLAAHAYCLSLDDADVGTLDECGNGAEQEGSLKKKKHETVGKKGDREASVTAWIVYEVPSVTTLITGDTPSSRHVQVALPSSVLPFSNKQACKEALKTCLEDSAKGVCNGNWDANAVSMVLTSVEPYMNKSGKVGLNFQGRGRLPSNKNMQLSVPMMANYEDGGDAKKRTRPLIAFQMAKWENKVYNVDFTAPLTPFLAFGTALAQMDI